MRARAFILSLFAPALVATAALEKVEIYKKREFSSGFLIPANISVEDYDVSEDLMIPVESLDFDDDWDVETTDFSGAEGLFATIVDDENVEGSNMSKREEKETNFLVGKTLVDFGCDASIRKPLEEAIHSLCYNGLCDGGTTYTRKVKYMGEDSPIEDASLQINIEGNYQGKDTRGHIAALVKSMVTPKTAIPEVREYFSSTGQQNVVNQRCNMSKFGNYIAVHKQFEPDTVDVRIRITLKGADARCIGDEAFEEAIGAFSGPAALFFSKIIPDCREE